MPSPTLIQRLPRIPTWLTPVRAAFAGSLLLSLTARLGGTLNRDGMLYVTTAQAYLDGGFAAAKASFSWPFLSIAMAIISQLTGLTPDTAGYLLNAFFMAGACALMVSLVRQHQPEIAWLACLTVLALPGLNEYRNELLREYGCWFFIMLSFWLANRWHEQPKWKLALATQASLFAAALFRPEALTLFGALMAWQIFSGPASHRERWRRAAMIGALPLAGGVALVALFLGGYLTSSDRLAIDLGRLSTERFDAKARILASGLIDYARGQARTILLYGSLALIPLKLIQKFGLFLVPLAYLFIRQGMRPAFARYPLFGWAMLLHLGVLAVFVTDLQFLAGRYVGLILLLSTPFAAMGLWLLARDFPRWKKPMLALTLALAVANVVSFGQGKAHFVEAGQWLGSEAVSPADVYIDSGRAAFHAGWKKDVLAPRNDPEAMSAAVRSGRYQWFILERSRKDASIGPWLERSELKIVRRFGVEGGDEVIVATPAGGRP